MYTYIHKRKHRQTVYIYIYIYIYICICICIYHHLQGQHIIAILAHSFQQALLRLLEFFYTHTHTHTLCLYTHIYKFIYIYTHTIYMYMYIYIYIYIYMNDITCRVNTSLLFLLKAFSKCFSASSNFPMCIAHEAIPFNNNVVSLYLSASSWNV